MVSAEVTEFDDSKVKASLTDRASALINQCFAVGSIFGPILGGALNDKYGYYFTCHIMFYTSVFTLIFYVLLVILYDILTFKKKSV